jgi:hypothetical protein
MAFHEAHKKQPLSLEKEALNEAQWLRTASFMFKNRVICNSKDSIFGDYLHSICHQEWLIFLQAISQELTK